MDLEQLQADVEKNLVSMLNDPDILKRFDISEEDAQEMLKRKPKIQWVEEEDEG